MKQVRKMVTLLLALLLCFSVLPCAVSAAEITGLNGTFAVEGEEAKIANWKYEKEWYTVSQTGPEGFETPYEGYTGNVLTLKQGDTSKFITSEVSVPAVAGEKFFLVGHRYKNPAYYIKYMSEGVEVAKEDAVIGNVSEWTSFCIEFTVPSSTEIKDNKEVDSIVIAFRNQRTYDGYLADVKLIKSLAPPITNWSWNGANVNTVVANGQGNNGADCIKFTAASNGGNALYAYNTIALEKGKAYVLSFDLKVEQQNNNATMERPVVNIIHSDGTAEKTFEYKVEYKCTATNVFENGASKGAWDKHTALIAPATFGEFGKQSISFVVPNHDSYVQTKFEFKVHTGTNHIMYLSNVELKEDTSHVELASGAGFPAVGETVSFNFYNVPDALVDTTTDYLVFGALYAVNKSTGTKKLLYIEPMVTASAAVDKYNDGDKSEATVSIPLYVMDQYVTFEFEMPEKEAGTEYEFVAMTWDNAAGLHPVGVRSVYTGA